MKKDVSVGGIKDRKQKGMLDGEEVISFLKNLMKQCWMNLHAANEGK